MKKTLLYLLFLLGNTFAFSQIAFSAFSTSNITENSASLNAYVTINCANGGNFHAQYSTSPSFSPFTNATGGSVFVSYARTINISGLAPSTTYYWRYYGNLGTNCNPTVVYSATQSFTTSASTAVTLPSITSVSASNITSGSASINYSLIANNGATTSVVKYGLSNTTLTSQATGFTASGTTPTPGSVTLTGLTPSTQYYFQVEATNSAGPSSSSVGSFTTSAPLTPQLIAQYNFDNSYTNINGSAPFASSIGTSFVTDRNGNTNSAINIVDSGTTATIPNLPYSNNPRTVSLWFKLNSLNGAGFNFLYTYGNTSNYYGTYVNGGTTYHFGNTGSHSIAATTVAGTWYHLVLVYDGVNSRIYRNGVLLSESAKSWNTINNSDLFRLGLTENGSPNYLNGAIDDLKIYNYAVSAADVTSLYNNNTVLGTDSFQSGQLQAVLYPNPTSDAFTIEMESKVKSVEIYSLQGQKVMASTSKSANVSHLTKGIYLVRIEDENQAVTKQKLIIK